MRRKRTFWQFTRGLGIVVCILGLAAVAAVMAFVTRSQNPFTDVSDFLG